MNPPFRLRSFKSENLVFCFFFLSDQSKAYHYGKLWVYKVSYWNPTAPQIEVCACVIIREGETLVKCKQGQFTIQSNFLDKTNPLMWIMVCIMTFVCFQITFFTTYFKRITISFNNNRT